MQLASGVRRLRLWRLVRMQSSPSPRTYQVVATVPTGLERGAAEECREVLGRVAGITANRGSITCTLESPEELVKVIGRSVCCSNYEGCTISCVKKVFCV